ncbi:MAG: hypothetical protein AAF587_10555 [Bacteroidota bacterium]
MKDIDPKEFLLFGLKHYGLHILKVDGNYIHIVHDYAIEIEGPSLFKLLHEGQVVAPFASVEELCEFIKADIQLNHG